MKKTTTGLFILLAITMQLSAEKVNVTSKLNSVNIFRVGAEMTHTAKIALQQGSNEVVIEGLSSDVEINSIQVKCSGNATLMSSEFSKDYLKNEEDKNVKKLQDSISWYEKESAQIQAKLNTNKELGELLRANKSIAGTQNGLSVAELTKMMDYYKTKSLELENEKNVLNEKAKDISLSLTVLKKQLEVQSVKNNKVFGNLTMQILCPVAGTYSFTVSYYTRLASWNPYYDLNIENAEKANIAISYKAKVKQTTGLDWKKVKLTLSTSMPNTNKTAPVFKTWFLDFVNTSGIIGAGTGYGWMAPQQSASNYIQGLYFGEALGDKNKITIRGIGTNEKTSSSPLYVVNGEPVENWQADDIDPNLIEDITVLKNASATSIYGARGANGVILITLKNKVEDFISEKESIIDMTYDIDLNYDILGNGTEQLITLKNQSLPTVYKYYSAPKLDKAAFLLAEISGWENLNLLPGEANITYDGTYIGKSSIDPLSTQNILNLTLSEDKRVVVTREKMQDFSKTKMFDKDKKQEFAYKLTVKNTKSSAINMILKEQYPISMQKEIEVELVESSNASNNSEIGVLTWIFPLNPGESKEFTVKYTVKYPKNRMLN